MMKLFYLTVCCYLFAGFFSAMAIKDRFNYSKWLMLILGVVALTLHAVILYQWIDLTNGQNLNFLNMVSFSVWITAILIWVLSLFYRIDLLPAFVYPLAALSMIVVRLLPGFYIVDMSQRPEMLFHILISIFTFCVLMLAGLLAILILLQERLLRFNKVSGIIEKLPSLQTMEILLFKIVGCGFILLNLVLVTSFYSYHYLLLQNLYLLQKTLLAVVAWAVLLLLLLGRHYHGWRGMRAVRYTMTAVLLLLSVYFFNKSLLTAFSVGITQ